MADQMRFRLMAPLVLVAGVGLYLVLSGQEPAPEKAPKSAALAVANKGKAPRPFAESGKGVAQLAQALKGAKAAPDRALPKLKVEQGANWYTAKCDACMSEKCVEARGSALDLCPLDDAECRSVLDCEMRSRCITGTRGAASCYCGSVEDLQACAQGGQGAVPDGPCKSEIEAAMGSRDSKTIVTQFATLDSAAGRAHRVVMCMTQRCLEACIPQERE